MARTSKKSTYALDVETTRKLDRMAARWKVPKSEVLRRAIAALDRAELGEAASPLKALDELQKCVKLTKRQADRWSLDVRGERARTSARHEWPKR
jgi:predicted transcriptional regulator